MNSEQKMISVLIAFYWGPQKDLLSPRLKSQAYRHGTFPAVGLYASTAGCTGSSLAHFEHFGAAKKNKKKSTEN